MEPHRDSAFIVDERVREKYLGLLEGTTYYAPRSKEAEASVELWDTFLGRLLHFWDDLFPPASLNVRKSILPLETKKALTVLVVSHGGPIKVLVPSLAKERSVVWSPEALKQAQTVKCKVHNCSVTEVTMSQTAIADGKYPASWSGVINRYRIVLSRCLRLCADFASSGSFADIRHFHDTAVHNNVEADEVVAAKEDQAGKEAEPWHSRATA